MEQAFKWQREGAGEEATPGSLEFFLIERYRLFAHDSGRDRLFFGTGTPRAVSLQHGEARGLFNPFVSLEWFAGARGDARIGNRFGWRPGEHSCP